MRTQTQTKRAGAAPRPAAGGNRKARRQAARKRKRQAAAPGGQSAGDTGAVLARAARDLKEGRDRQAHAAYRSILERAPDHAGANFGMALLHEKARDMEGAYRFYKAAAAGAPHEAKYWRQLGVCLKELKQFEAAAVALRQAIAAAPDEAGYYVDLARVLFARDDTETAMQVLDKALDADPGCARAHYQKGVQEQARGDFASARGHYERALECDPGLIEVHYQFTAMRETCGPPDEVVRSLLNVLEDENLETRRRALVHYTVARIRQRQGRHDEAFAAYAKANAESRKLVSFDGSIVTGMVDQLVAAFTPEVFPGLKSAGIHTRQPVFIVGMPRSGTTLVEQIISSHPQAGDGGEVRKMAQLAQTLWSASQDDDVKYPRDIARLDPERLRAVGQDYLDHIRQGRPEDVGRITDKLPLNFFHLGLIRVLFPDAAIIHCRRDPMDTCLSCFFQNFAEADGLAFTFDLEELGFYYRQYQRMMAHWRAVLPGPFMEVQYEELVANQEEMSRALVAFAGLEWDDACLRFHETERSVKTASHWQVRQPVYTSSVAAWRKYEKHLEPLRAALAGETGADGE